MRGKSLEPVITIEERIQKIRAGYKQTLELKLGDLVVPVRLLDAQEEINIIQQAKIQVAKLPEQTERKLQESLAVIKATLAAAATVQNVPLLPMELLGKLSHAEIEALYDQYQTICRSVNPEFEKLTDQEAAELIGAIKKKERKPSELFTWQLAAIGRYFLEAL